jgi:hypothetical protein
MIIAAGCRLIRVRPDGLSLGMPNPNLILRRRDASAAWGLLCCKGASRVTDYRKLFDLTGKTAVVLGAASGIGKASAEALT